MALYAIGDVQGCYDALRRLLDKLRFDPAVDRLWFTGDLVNRGPASAAVLRLVASLGDCAVAVLGNHDLHLLAVAAETTRPLPQDTCVDVLSAPDRDALLDWLRRRPLFHYDTAASCALVHAGLLPAWTIGDALSCAREAESVIQGEEATAFFQAMYGDEPRQWSDALQGWDRIRLIVNAFTRLRFCDPSGQADYEHKGPPGSQPAPLVPWFAAPARRSAGTRIVFGHWSLLGRWMGDDTIGVDSGCLWGRELSAVRLAGGPLEFITVACGAKH